MDLMDIGETLTYKCDGGKVLDNNPSVGEIDVVCDEGNSWTEPLQGWHDCIDSEQKCIFVVITE